MCSEPHRFRVNYVIGYSNVPREEEIGSMEVRAYSANDALLQANLLLSKHCVDSVRTTGCGLAKLVERKRAHVTEIEPIVEHDSCLKLIAACKDAIAVARNARDRSACCDAMDRLSEAVSWAILAVSSG